MHLCSYDNLQMIISSNLRNIYLEFNWVAMKKFLSSTIKDTNEGSFDSAEHVECTACWIRWMHCLLNTLNALPAEYVECTACWTRWMHCLLNTLNALPAEHVECTACWTRWMHCLLNTLNALPAEHVEWTACWIRWMHCLLNMLNELPAEYVECTACWTRWMHCYHCHKTFTISVHSYHVGITQRKVRDRLPIVSTVHTTIYYNYYGYTAALDSQETTQRSPSFQAFTLSRPGSLYK